MLDRLTPPPFIRSTSFDLLKPLTSTVPAGATIQFVSGGMQDVLHIELIFNAGRWFEQKTGTSHFASNLLLKGTEKKTSSEIAQIFDQYGAHVEISPGLDTVAVSLYSLVSNLKPVLELFYEVMVEPAFPEKELRQNKSIFLQNLKINNEKTSFLASKLIRKKIFGVGHPYGKDFEEEDVKSIQQNQLTTFHNEFFRGAEIFVSGKISEASQKLITETFAGFQNASKVKLKVPDDATITTSETYVEKEGSVQTSIRLGKKSILRSHPDYVDVVFLNHILGGYFGSRLMKNIREEKGLSYGISSTVQALKNDCFVSIGADVNKTNRSLATKEIKLELDKLCSHKIKQEEIDTARYHFIGSLQSELSTPFAHAEKIKNILLHNLPIDFYQKMINRISTISDTDLRSVAEKHFASEDFTEVAVG
jgi:zinc protease